MKVILIAAVTQDGFIAHHRNETITWSKDLALFKSQTMGHPVIMGSNTFNCIQKDLLGRKIIVIHRNNDPEDVLREINADRCFIAGGGKTNTRFSPFLTHLYLTPHPHIFGNGIRLFSDPVNPMELKFERIIPVDEKTGIYQYQYKIN